jgi:hypothetical protein
MNPRNLVWGLVGCLLLSGGLAYFWPAPRSEITFTPADQQALVNLEDYGEWIAAFEKRLPVGASPRQVVIVQAIPDQAPLVVGTTIDTSDEEEATHWPSPWPAVNEALKAGRLDEPVVVSGNYQSFRYRHHLFPFDETGSRCLLVNETAPPGGFGWLPATLVGAALVLALTLLVTGRGD